MIENIELRQLTNEELSAVAGGDIVVTGNPLPDPYLLDQLAQMRFVNPLVFRLELEGLGGGSGTLPGSSPYTSEEDSDGDGIPNWEEDPIVVTADPGDIRELQALARLASDQATGIMFAVTVALGAERAAAEAVMAVLVRIFGSEAVAGAVAAGAGFVGSEVTHAELTNLLTQIHFSDWEADNREIEMPQPGDWDYVGDPRGIF